MEAFKKTETLITAVLAIVLIGYIAYDYRKHNAESEKIKQIEEHLSATVRTVDGITQQTARINPMIQELVKLKERQEELEEIEEKYEELLESLEEILQSLKAQGITIDVELPEFGDKKKKKKKKGKKDKKSKKTKKSKKSKKDESSSESEETSEDDKDKALDRMSRVRSGKKDKK